MVCINPVNVSVALVAAMNICLITVCACPVSVSAALDALIDTAPGTGGLD